MRLSTVLILATSLLSVGAHPLERASNNTVSLSITDASNGTAIPSTMHGVILETNINSGSDGGLYAELVYNRAFQVNGGSLDGWTAKGGSIVLSMDGPVSTALPAHLTLTPNGNGVAGISNGGFSGIALPAQTYVGSFYYKPANGSKNAGNVVTASLRSSSGTTYGSVPVKVAGVGPGQWKQFSFKITTSTAASNANNAIVLELPAGSTGSFSFNLISIFPPTFKQRGNGVRADIAQAFSDLKPGFIRLPGGNDIEGNSIPDRYIWNATIGPLVNRPGRNGTWQGYNTEGLGLMELLTFAQDIGAAPLLAFYAGYSLNGNVVPQSQLQPYIQSVLDELDFLFAGSNNQFGRLRIQNGQSAPYNVKNIEVGNEDFLDSSGSYKYRWPAFYSAMSKAYPNVDYVATTLQGISTPPTVDNHDYNTPKYFIDNFRRYDTVPRPGPKVFEAEFAVISDKDNSTNPFTDGRLQTSSVKSAVAENVFRISFERNADVVLGGCYAPVLQNVANVQWTPNLVLFDASKVVKSVSWYAQQIFGTNLGNMLLKSGATNANVTTVTAGGEGDGKIGNLYFVATKDTTNNHLIVKLANVDSNPITITGSVVGNTGSGKGTGSAYTVAAPGGVDPSTVTNTFANPNVVGIQQSTFAYNNHQWTFTVPGWGTSALVIPL